LVWHEYEKGERTLAGAARKLREKRGLEKLFSEGLARVRKLRGFLAFESIVKGGC